MSYRSAFIPRFNGTVEQLERERAEREGTAVETAAAVPTTDPLALPLGQKIVLLKLRGGELARKILEHPDEWGAEVVKSDWTAMIAAGYVMRAFGPAMGPQGRLTLTPRGLSIAIAIARELARRLNIHHVTRGKAMGNQGPYVRCTCGWQTYSSIRNSASLDRHVADHQRQARSGTLPPAYAPPSSEQQTEARPS